MDDQLMQIGTIKVKFKPLPDVPYIIINESDFDENLMTLYEEPPAKEEPPVSTGTTATTGSTTTSSTAKEADDTTSKTKAVAK